MAMQTLQQRPACRSGCSFRSALTVSRRVVHCKAVGPSQETRDAPSKQSWRQNAVAIATAAALIAGGSTLPAAVASEFDLLSSAKPTSNYLIDDANVLNKITKSELATKLKILEVKTGFRLEVATVRKLEFETDAFALADKVLESWYPTKELGDKQGLLLVVTSGKDGALVGGPSFTEAIGDELVDSIISANIPILTEEERYNEAVNSSVERIEAKLTGSADPGAPQRADNERKRTYKTKEEVDKSRDITTTVVGSLLVIAFVVPMLQFYGYTARD